MGWRDEWPSSADGIQYDGRRLMELVQEGKNPFAGQWDLRHLVREIEEHVGVQIADIPFVARGSNNFGINLKTVDGRELVARLSRGDVNMPDFDGFPLDSQVPEVRFEAAIYHLLRSEPAIKVSTLLYHRVPMQHPSPKPDIPKDLAGRRLLLFEKARGHNNLWDELSMGNKMILLNQLASVRAALSRFEVPGVFADRFLHDRIFKFKPDAFTLAPAPTRKFWMYALISKIEATIKSEGDIIGWEDDNETVGPVALAAKESLLRAIPIIVPEDNPTTPLYRLVIDHGDFGIHNITIEQDTKGCPQVTSLYDWETGSIVPALLVDLLAAVKPVDLTTDNSGGPRVTRIPKNATEHDLHIYQGWAKHYIEKIYEEAPELRIAIEAGKNMRHLWFTLRDWRGGHSENFFGALGIWAEGLMRENRPTA